MTKKVLYLFVMGLIIMIGGWARFHLAGSIPFAGDNMDEYSNVWVGLSLIKLGMPVGNTYAVPKTAVLSYRYINVDRIFSATENTAQMIVYPWLDHPPLLSLITGGFSYLKGARNFEDISVATARKPMIAFSIISILLVAILSYLVGGKIAALISTAIYAVSPYLIISSRIIQGENGYIPLMILTVILLIVYKQKQNIIWLILAGLVAGVATWFKVSAISLIPSGVLILMVDKKLSRIWRELVIFSLISISICGLYFVYGLAIDPKAILWITLFNANRVYGIGPQAIFRLISESIITGKGLEDGWKLAGLLAMIVLIGLPKTESKIKYLVIPFICHLAIYVLFGSYAYGWYTFPLWPFVIMALGYVLAQGLTKTKDPLLALVMLLIPLGVNLNRLISSDVFSRYSSGWRLLLFISLLTSLSLWLYPKNRWLTRAIIVGLLMCALVISLLRFDQINITSWYSIN